MLKNKDISAIPASPGVYLFKAGDKILYIGKAKELNKRVAHYFQGRDHLIIDNLLNKADDIEWIVTDSEKDALLLEYNLIHTYNPPFNVKLKDDKRYPFIEITLGDEFPGIYFSRQVTAGNFYAGPIIGTTKTRRLIDALTAMFKLRVCTNTIFNRHTQCLYSYIDRCSAPCVGKIDNASYAGNVSSAVEVLKGKRKKILDQWTHKMTLLAENLAFEEAQKLKEDIERLTVFELDSYISSAKKIDYDVIALHLDYDHCFIIQFSVVSGNVTRKAFYNFNSVNLSEEEVLKEFLISFYGHGTIPAEIIVRFLPADSDYLEGLFSQLMGHKVVIKSASRGDKAKMSLLAAQNLSLYVKKTDYTVIAARLKQALNLKQLPHWIEAFDISHFSERERVGAAVAFVKGNPDRKKYRNYLIKQAQPGDTEALKEVLERRFKKAEEFPDLLVIDGGKGQLGAALEIKTALGLPVDVVAIAKGEERLFMEKGGSIVLPEDAPESFLIRNLRDEVHRRAVTHHRKRRDRTLLPHL